MKKGRLILAMCLVIALLAGCGQSSTKRGQVQEELDELDTLCQRVGTAVTAINTAVAASEIVSADFSAYYTALLADRDELSYAFKDSKQMGDDELDAFSETVNATLAQAVSVTTHLEGLLPEIERLADNAEGLVRDLSAIVPLAQGDGVAPELQREYTELAAAYPSIEGQLNSILQQAQGEDLAQVLSVLQQANTALGELSHRAESLLANLQA